jgi:ATP-dependent Zn protease
LEDVQAGTFEALKEVPRDSGAKLSDVKGVDEAKADLEDIVHYLRDTKVSGIVIDLRAGVLVN